VANKTCSFINTFITHKNKKMKTIIHKADSRGSANHGWLNAKHSFSFANYHNPDKVHFGVLRVLNDDIVAPSMGFGMHPHDNMEIITIPLKGALKHRDNMGNEGVINAGDVQVMSAGTGVMHSEFNPSATDEVSLFQIWIFPNIKNATPRYDQKSFNTAERKNKFQLIVSPEKNGSNLWVNQNAFFSLADLDAGSELTYTLNTKTNGIYLMNIDGEIELSGNTLIKRDAIAITDANEITIKAKTSSSVLVMEVPMN
jgi:redox-sensitive bicupin YhaK (pirin superfamily)